MRKAGINSKTPEEIELGAGTIFKNLKYVYKKAEESSAGAIEVVTDGTVETTDTIQLSKLNPDVSFIGVAEDYTEPKVGDFVVGEWDDSEENVLGATSGGNKVSIVPEYLNIEVDGATVKIKGLTQKVAETGSIETNLVQHNIESFKRAIVGEEVDSLIKGFRQVVTKSLLELSDYLDNIAYVGVMTSGEPIIVIMENALCTSGYESDKKNKEASIVTATFESHADFKSGIYDKLPIYIFTPEEATA